MADYLIARTALINSGAKQVVFHRIEGWVIGSGGPRNGFVSTHDDLNRPRQFFTSVVVDSGKLAIFDIPILLTERHIRYGGVPVPSNFKAPFRVTQKVGLQIRIDSIAANGEVRSFQRQVAWLYFDGFKYSGALSLGLTDLEDIPESDRTYIPGKPFPR